MSLAILVSGNLRHAQVVVITATPPDRAEQYQGLFRFEHPYLCDPNFTVHRQYGLRPVGGREMLKTNALTMVAQVTERPSVTLMPDDVAELNAYPMEQGLFIIDESGLIQYVFVTLASGKLPTAATLLAELDGQTRSS